MEGSQKTASVALALVTGLFFVWGFITALVDPLIAAVKSIFLLSNVEAQLSAFAFFIAYGLVSVPAALLVARVRPVPAILLALGLMAGGCLVILAGSNLASYKVVLLGLFIIASGITILQVSANPLVAALGAPERMQLRLTFSQAFNSLGTVIGPLLGAKLLLHGLEPSTVGVIAPDVRGTALQALDGAFLILAVLIALFACFIWAMKRRIEAAAPPSQQSASLRQAFSSGWALLGGVTIFLYVGAEVSIGTQMTFFLNDPGVWNMPLQQAGYFVSLYWLGAMVGRFVGAGFLVWQPAYRLLAIAASVAGLLCLSILAIGGVLSGYLALGVGLFNSIMFPAIFALTLERSSASEEVTSGLLCTAIAGGAFLPLLAGGISDVAGYRLSFVVPALCYLLICAFALLAARVSPSGMRKHGAAPVPH